MNQALINYIQKAKAAGKSDEEIKNTALGMEWKDNDIAEAFKAVAGDEGLPAQAGVSVPPPTPEAVAVQAVPSKAFPVKLILIIIAALLIIGGGAAYYFLVIKSAQEAVQQPPIEQPHVPVSPQEQPLAPPEETQPPAAQPMEETRTGSVTKKEFTCKLEPRNNYIIVSGRIDFPKGIKNPQDYSMVMIPETYEISPDRGFCGYIVKGKVKFFGAFSNKSENDFPLAIIVNPDADLNITVDAFSTAVAMVFMNPFLLNNNPVQAEQILSKIRENPKVKELADAIKNKEELSQKDIEEGGVLYQIYVDAITAVLKS